MPARLRPFASGGGLAFSGEHKQKAKNTTEGNVPTGTKSQIESNPVAWPTNDAGGTASALAGRVKATPRDGQSFHRRCLRVHLDIPIRVYGHGPNQKPFLEETRTLNVSVQGALITLTISVDRHQKLILTNSKTREEVECRVAHVGSTEMGRTEVGIEFISPSPRFWHITFPPDNWNPAERKRPPLRRT